MSTVSFAHILEHVTAYRGVTKTELLGRSRRQHIARARQEVYYLAREFTRMSWPCIARVLHRDHTTCLVGRRAVIRRTQRNDDYRSEVTKMAADLRAMAAHIGEIRHANITLKPFIGGAW